MITLGMACALATNLIALPDKITYERMVEIVRVEASPVPGKEKRHRVEVTFNLIPDMPKGVKILFELQRQGLKVGPDNEAYVYTLDNESRKGCKLVFTPSERLSVDTYSLANRIPLADQTPEVRKAIEAKPSRFPPKETPWPFNHMQQEFKVGNEEDAAAEQKEVADFIQSKVERILELNNEGIEELDKARNGSLKPDLLGKFLAGWVKRMAAVQNEISEFIVAEPGLFSKHEKLHHELAELGRLVAKRITRTELGDILKKNNLPPGAVKVTAVGGFNPNYLYGTGKSELTRRWEAIQRIIDPDWKPDEDESGSEEEAGKDGKAPEDGKAADEGKAEGKGPEKKKEAKDETPSPGPKKGEKAKPGSKTSKTQKKKTDQKKPAGKKAEE